MAHIRKFNESKNVQINESDESSTFNFIEPDDLYKVTHKGYQNASDVVSLVKANSEEEAKQILDEYLATKPNGVYTSEPTDAFTKVYKLKILSKK